MSKWNPVRCCVAIILVMLLVSCGSSPSSDSDPASSPAALNTISGVASAGGPVNGMVYLKDSSSPPKTLSAAIAPDGSFSFDATGLTMPCRLISMGLVQNSFSTLHSLASAPGTVNISPLSTLAIKLVTDNDPDTLYTATDPAKVIEAAASFRSAVAQLRDALKGTLSVFGAADIDFVADKVTANHLGLDLMFDLIAMDYLGSGDIAELRFVDKTTGREDVRNPNYLLPITVRPATPPLTAGNICVLPAAPLTYINENIALSAVVIGTQDQRVSWSVAGAASGAISSDGVYTAPAKPGIYSVTASTGSRQTTIQIQVQAPSSSPDPFTFADKTASLALAVGGGVVLSDAVTITGTNPNGWKLSISDTGSNISNVLIDGTYYLDLPDTPLPYIRPGQSLMIVQMPSPVVGGTSVTTVTVGDYSTTFTTKTVN